MASSLVSQKASAAGVQLANRPGYGTKGRPVSLAVNAFAAAFKDQIVYQYDVATTPGDLSKDTNRLVWRQLEQDQAFGQIKVVFDGQKIAYAPKKLALAQGTAGDYSVQIEDGGPNPRAFKVRLTEAAEINFHELGLFLKQQIGMSANVLMCINALNVALTHEATLRWPSRVNFVFPPAARPQDRMQLSGGYTATRGLWFSIRPSLSGLIINVDTSAGVFYNQGTLHDAAAAFLGCRVQDIPKAPDRLRIKLKNWLTGVKVGAPIQGDPKRTYGEFKIKQVSSEPAKKLKMKDDRGNDITVENFFRQYNIRLNHPDLPCVRLTARAWYPMELVAVSGGVMRKKGDNLTEKQIAEILAFCTHKPGQKKALVTEGYRQLGIQQSATLADWGLKVDPQLSRVDGRVLDPPKLSAKMSNKNTKAVIMPYNGAYDLRSKAFLKPAQLSKWGVIVYDIDQGPRGFQRRDAEALVSNFLRAFKDCGILCSMPQPPIVYAGHSSDIKAYFKQVREALGGGDKGIPQLVVCLLGERTFTLYSAIKNFGDNEVGCATQVLRIPKARKGQPAYFKNVSLKINIKLGGQNIALEPNVQMRSIDIAPSTTTNTPTILFGADCLHPGPGSVKPSIAAVVASSDLQGLTYATETRLQLSRQEIIGELDEIASNLLRNYRAKTKKVPSRIIFFRDGVSEGQFGEVTVREIKALKRACERIDMNYKPKITYVVCGKRHHIRFLPTDDSDKNAPVGTVVDRGIVNPASYDFYLLSHEGMLGTSKPTHYTVLLDENNFKPDEMQTLCYNQCWIFPRCTRAVSIVAPTYFADLVATRAQEHLNAAMSVDSFDTASLASSRQSRDKAALNDAKQKALDEARQFHKTVVHPKLANTLYFM